MEDGVDVPQTGRLSFATFESNVLFVLRFMIDTGVVGGSWVTAHAGKYTVGGGSNSTRIKLSTCQIDIHLSYRCVYMHAVVCTSVHARDQMWRCSSLLRYSLVSGFFQVPSLFCLLGLLLYFTSEVVKEYSL